MIYDFNERTKHFFIKMYLSHFILERVDVSVVCERWVETGTDCYIDPTSALEHSMLCYLQEAALHFFRILAGIAQPGVLSRQAGSHSALPVPTDSTAVGICLYYFITPSCFYFFFRLFSQVHLWLTARSRVNM